MKISWMFFISLALFSVSEGKEFTVDSTQNNVVIFYAKATLGSFSGETDQITGYLKWEGEDTLKSG